MAEVPDQAQRDVSAQGQSFRLLSLLPRLLPIFAALWLGVLITIGLLVAPTLFAHLPRAEAGRIAGLLFGVEARFSVLAGGLLFLLLQGLRRAQDVLDPGQLDDPAATSEHSRAAARISHLLAARPEPLAGQPVLAPRLMNRLSLWVLAALFFTVAGHFGVQPWMELAKAGQGPLSFATLHGVSMMFFAAKGLCVAVLAWRLSLLPSS